MKLVYLLHCSKTLLSWQVQVHYDKFISQVAANLVLVFEELIDNFKSIGAKLGSRFKLRLEENAKVVQAKGISITD